MRHAYRRSLSALAAAAILAGTGTFLQAQEEQPIIIEDDFFGEETIVEAAPLEGSPQDEFLKYDEVKVDGSFTGSMSLNAYWDPAWDGSLGLADAERSLNPTVAGKLTFMAKPRTDFGVNMDFRTSWPFSRTNTIADSDGDTFSYSVPDIDVWAMYSKFSWNDSLYFSFGKQPLGWGASQGFFQPADDIFSTSAVDPTDTLAAREGPVSLQASFTLPRTLNSFYFYAGVPDLDSIGPEDIRFAAKASLRFGDLGLGLGGFYSYDDYPRAVAFLNTGFGDFNVYGEAILKYGSERYFIEGTAIPHVFTGVQNEDRLYVSGTFGGRYSGSEGKLSISAQYYYNGEAQMDVGYREAFFYYTTNSSSIDRMRFGEHYAFASLSRTELFTEKLSAMVFAMSNLSDLSGFVSPSLTYRFFDFVSLQVGAVFNWGEPGSEFIVASPASGLSFTDKPGAALNMTLTLGTGSF